MNSEMLGKRLLDDPSPNGRVLLGENFEMDLSGEARLAFEEFTRRLQAAKDAYSSLQVGISPFLPHGHIDRVIPQFLDHLEKLQEHSEAKPYRPASGSPRGSSVSRVHYPFPRAASLPEEDRVKGAERRGRLFFEQLQDRLPQGSDLADRFDLTGLNYRNTGSHGGAVARVILPLGPLPSGFRFPEGDAPIQDILADFHFYRASQLAAVKFLLQDDRFVSRLEERFTEGYHQWGFKDALEREFQEGLHVDRRGVWGRSIYDPAPEDNPRSLKRWARGVIRTDETGKTRFFVEDFCFYNSAQKEWMLPSIAEDTGQTMEIHRTAKNQLWHAFTEITGMRLGSLGARLTRNKKGLSLYLQATHYPLNTLRASVLSISEEQWRFVQFVSPDIFVRSQLVPDSFPSKSRPSQVFSAPNGPVDPELARFVSRVPPVQRQFGLPVDYRVYRDLERYHPLVESRETIPSCPPY